MEKPLRSGSGRSVFSKDLLAEFSRDWVAEMFDALIDAIDVGVYVLDCSGTIQQVNRFVLDHYDWTEQELLGQNIFELLPDLGDIGVEHKFNQVIHERRIVDLTNLQREDRTGRNVVFNLRGVPIMEGGEIKGVLAVTNDITEKRVLESQVAETEEYLENLIDNANDIIYTLDVEGHITFLNKMGQEITGYSFTPAGQGHYTDYVVKTDRAKNEKYFRLALKGEPQRYSSAIVAMDGRLVHVLINITPIKKGDDVVGVLGIARDITERKQMEAQLLQANKMAAIGELAAGVAHEINNPVGIISGAAEQLEFLIELFHDDPEKTSDRVLKHIDVIREQAARCKKITQGLLNFARRTEIQTRHVGVSNLVMETVALVENRALAEKKTIETDLSPDLPIIDTDPHQLEQVFLNLVNNALDATEQGGAVLIRAREKEGFIVVDVVDRGPGIPEEDLKKIFDPFFTTKPIGKGTGLGLSICFGIVQRMDGTITVDSKIGGGTTFTIRLPIRQPGTGER